MIINWGVRLSQLKTSVKKKVVNELQQGREPSPNKLSGH
jgi:hypothetical protein